MSGANKGPDKAGTLYTQWPGVACKWNGPKGLLSLGLRLNPETSRVASRLRPHLALGKVELDLTQPISCVSQGLFELCDCDLLCHIYMDLRRSADDAVVSNTGTGVRFHACAV